MAASRGTPAYVAPEQPVMAPPSGYLNAFLAGNAVVTVRRNELGHVIRGEVPAQYACFLRADDVTEELERALRSSRFVRGLSREGAWVRVTWIDKWAVAKAAAKDGWFAARRIQVFEADVDPVRRWITDAGIQIVRPRAAFIDLETDDRRPFSQIRQARILAWSLVNIDGSVTQAQVLEADSNAGEQALLRALFTELGAYDQVIAWNGQRFDFPQLEARCEAVGFAVEFRRWLWLDHMVLFGRMNASASESGEEKQSLALGNVAKAVLGADEAKLIKLGELDGKGTWARWVEGGEEREKLRLYCLDDSLKMQRIEEKTGYVDLHFACCEATSCFPDTRGINPTQQVEGFLLRLGRDPARDMHFPTHYYAEAGDAPSEAYRGAYVMEPSRKGITREVHVADFSRLYPSIILSWNMSLETWRPDIRVIESDAGRPSYLSHLPLQRYPLPEGHCAAAITNQVFVNEPEGILPAALREMLRLRKHWDEVKKHCPPDSREWVEAARRSAAYKIAANSFYGVIGSPFSRFFERAVAESVSLGSVFLIEETIRAAGARGWKVIYGDTDSIFVTGCTQAEFAGFVAQCNAELYPRLLREKGCSRNAIELAYEKGFERVVFVGKKRYVGKVSHYKGQIPKEAKTEIKGLEYKRGDSSRLTRGMQKQAIDMLLAGEEAAAPFLTMVEQWKRRILFEPFELAEVVSSKRLTKPIRDYAVKQKADGTDAALPAHVEVAKILRSRGRDVGSGVRIEYLVVDGSTSPIKCVPAEDWVSIETGAASLEPTIADAPPGPVKLDRFYLWEDVYPATQRLLEAAFPAEQWTKHAKVRPSKLRGRAARELALPGIGDASPKQKLVKVAKKSKPYVFLAPLGRDRDVDEEELPQPAAQASLFGGRPKR